MKSLQSILIIFFVFCAGFSFSFSQGTSTLSQQQKDDLIRAQKNPVKATVLATVNIYNATSTQKGNDITVSFDMSNGAGVQPGLKYGIKLIQEKDKKQVTVDEYIYDSIFSLGENSSVHKTINYKAPQSLEGSYQLFISSKNVQGFPFGVSYVGDIVLHKTTESKGIVIDTESCFLTVEGEESNKKYTPAQGVDISKEENLLSNCIVENTSDRDIVATPVFVTRSRSIFGEMISTVGGDVTPVNLSSHAKKMVTTKLPKATSAQLYNLELRYGKESNPILYDYRIQGINGIVESVILDKEYYKKGETAKVSLVISAFNGGFIGSRAGTSTVKVMPSVTLSLKDKNGKACSSLYEGEIPKNQRISVIPLKVTSLCVNPKIEVSLSDAKVGLLSKASFDVETTTIVKNDTAVVYLLLIVTIIALSTVLVFVVYKKRKIKISSITTSFVFFFTVLSFISGAGNVKADTWSVIDNIGQDATGIHFVDVTTTYSGDLSVGGTVTVTADILYKTDNLGASIGGFLLWDIDKPSYALTKGPFCASEAASALPGTHCIINPTFTTPSPSGTHSLNFTYMMSYFNAVHSNYSMTFNAVAPVTAPSVTIKFSLFEKMKSVVEGIFSSIKTSGIEV